MEPPSTSPSSKLRFMCSNGGHILPRPHDKSLRYISGDTRILTIHRHTTLSDLTHRLSKTLFRSSTSSIATSSITTSSIATSAIPFTLKYQLPSEDLDSLISVTTDEDLENMIDEYDRLSSSSSSSSSSRIRLFVFPTSTDSVSSIGSFLENPAKSEDWFLNAVNGTNSGFSDTSSVNCLLDLDDEILLPEKKDVRLKSPINNNNNINSGHDVNSIPDSPIMETTSSSFGSDRSNKYREDGGLVNFPAPVAVLGSPVSSEAGIQEQCDLFLSCHEKLDQGLQMGYLKDHQQQSTGFDLGSMDSILSDLTIADQSSPVSQIQSSNYNNRVADLNDTLDQNTRIQNSTYLMSMPMPMPTTQVDSPPHQLHHQQPQFIPPLQYIHHHHHPSVAVPVTSYYQHHPHHLPTNQQNFMYYIPTMQPQGYNFPMQVDTQSVAPTKTELPKGVYRTSSGGPQLVRVSSGYKNQHQHVGYSDINQPTQSIYYATPLSATQQVRTAQP